MSGYRVGLPRSDTKGTVQVTRDQGLIVDRREDRS